MVALVTNFGGNQGAKVVLRGRDITVIRLVDKNFQMTQIRQKSVFKKKIEQES